MTIDHSWDPFFCGRVLLMMGAWWPWEDGESKSRCWMENFLMVMRWKYMAGGELLGSLLLVLSLGLLASRRIMAFGATKERNS